MKNKLCVFTIVMFCVLIGAAVFADEGHEHSGDKIKELVSRPLTLPLAIAGLVISFVLGGLHALTPGHGKAIVAAYLVGSKGSVIDAILLGIIVTFTHTFSVIALGVIMLFMQGLAPDAIVPWLSLSSGILIVIIGAWLLVKNVKQSSTRDAHAHEHPHGDPPDTHEHPHGSHTHTHGGETHTHEVPEKISFGGLLSLGISGGIVPCVDALIGLLFAISLGKLVWGLVILSAFSFGLAAVLVAIGILMVLAKPVIERFSGEGLWIKRLPIMSAAVVILLGTLLVFKAFRTIGGHI